MKILYLSVSYVPSRRASSVQVMRMCEAFAARGHQVSLVTKRTEPDGAADVFAYYGVAPTFDITFVPRPQRRGGELWFASRVVSKVLRRRAEIDLVYSRDLVGGAFAAQLGLPTVYEAHGIFERRWQRALWRQMISRTSFRGLVAISHAMLRELAAASLLPRDRPVLVAHSPANTTPDAAPKPRVGPRPCIGYVGSLYPGRGVDLVIDVARRMPQCTFELIGGSEADLAMWRSRCLPRNLVFRGYVPPGQLRAVYDRFDVLLMPYPHHGVYGATQRIDTARYCSPMKMFEYMGSGVPMVASDLPVLQEVLCHNRNALIAPYGDMEAWVQAIVRLLEDEPLRNALASSALTDLQAFTTEARVHKILGGLGLENRSR